MNLQKKIKDNVILHYVESKTIIYLRDFGGVIKFYELSFTYFGHHYIVRVKESDLTDGHFWPNVEGDSELYDSFEDACQDYLEKPIKEAISNYKKWEEEE
ncbi:hypothetical protein GO491_11875 [Flavobacteriaceae bacterium Ap0902]|nr:hypothetical protein [Flavobacteriaceae bacterium Ap0902]